MQLVYVKDLKNAISNRKNDDALVKMLENGLILGSKVKRSMENGVADKVDQYVRIPKYFLDDNFEIKCSDSNDRTLTLLSLWICAFAASKSFRMRVSTLCVTFDIDQDFLIEIVNQYGKNYGLEKISARIPSGRKHDFIRFSDPRSISKEKFLNIF